MLLPRFEYHEPASLEEASRILKDLGPQARLLAGGTDLLVNMKKGQVKPGHLVSLERVEGLQSMTVTNGGFGLGAMVRVASLARWANLPGWAKALAEGAESLGTPLVRNRATVAGNLVTARPAADLPPPLMALGARVCLLSKAGDREVSLETLFAGPGETRIRPEEILSEVRVDSPPGLTGSAYVKLGVRQTLEISIVNVAAALTLEKKGGPIVAARVVLGAVAPIPLRASSAENCLVGHKPSESLFEEAARAAATDARPIDDHRGSAEYRRWMVEVLTRRTLNLARIRAIGA